MFAMFFGFFSYPISKGPLDGGESVKQEKERSKESGHLESFSTSAQLLYNSKAKRKKNTDEIQKSIYKGRCKHLNGLKFQRNSVHISLTSPGHVDIVDAIIGYMLTSSPDFKQRI